MSFLPVLSRLIAPQKVPAKRRLLATLKLMSELVGALPDPACEALEASGVVGVWRSQLETLAGVSGRLTSAVDLAGAIRSAMRR